MDGSYVRRTVAGEVTVTHEPDVLRVVSAEDVSARVRRLFDLDCNPTEVCRALAGCPVIGPRVNRLPGLRIPGCWEPFELCNRVILGQQVSVKGASTLMGRLGTICPGFVREDLAQADLSSLGVPQRRAQTIRALAQAAVEGKLDFETRPWEQNAAALRSIPGVGPWTVDYLAIRLGRDSDAFPETDLGLLRATGVKSPRELLRLAEAWRPYRAYAAMYLWALQ